MQRKEEVNIDQEYLHPFRTACSRGDIQQIKNLIENNELPENISRCLEEATLSGKTDVVKILLKEFGPLGISSLGTAFIYAYNFNHKKIFELILNDPDVSLFKLGIFCFQNFENWLVPIDKIIQHQLLSKQNAIIFSVLKELRTSLPEEFKNLQKSLTCFNSGQLVHKIYNYIIKHEDVLKSNIEAYQSILVSKERASEIANQKIRDMKLTLESTYLKNSLFADNCCHIFAHRKAHDSKLPPELWEKIVQTAVTTTISSNRSIG